MRTTIRTALTLSLVAGLPLIAGAQPAELVFGLGAHLGTAHPKAQVPGASGVQFNNFGRLHRQPTASGWVAAPTSLPGVAASDQFLLLGNGLTAVNRAQEGVSIPTGRTAPLSFAGLFVPRVNDAGDWVTSYQESAASNSWVLTRGQGASIEVIREAGLSMDGTNTSFYGGSFWCWNMTSAGPTFLANTDALAEVALAIGPGVLQPVLFSGITEPTGQQGTPGVVRDIVTTTDRQAGFSTNATGTQYIANVLTTADAATDACIVVNGAVVAQEGFTPAWGTGNITAINYVWMESDGTWFARVTATDGQRIVRNGRTIAQIGQPIHPGTTEAWESFAEVRGDHKGNWVIVGNTGNPTLTDDVVVLNGKAVLARESEALDVNGDGATTAADAVDANGDPGDGAERTLFLHLFNNDRFTYANDGYVYFATRLKDSATGTAGAGSNNASLIRVKACTPDIAGSGQTIGRDGQLTADDIIVFIGWFFASDGRADTAGSGQTRGADGQFTADDIIVFINDFFAGC